MDQMVGQRIMVGFAGTSPSDSLLSRIRDGKVGGIILFSENIRSTSQVRDVTSRLQKAASDGGNPPLLISVDQEGGSIRRFARQPPNLSPPEMARTGDPATAEREGVNTGKALASAGVNVDLAPVVDVATSPQSFIARQGRSFGSDAHVVASFGSAFVKGLQSEKVAATAKHFPGVGSAQSDTDNKLETINYGPDQQDAALRPYRRLAGEGVDMVMLATAIFPAYGSNSPAALAAPVIRYLRKDVGFHGVTITDALESPTGQPSPAEAGVAAAQAGADIVLYTADVDAVFGALRDAVRSHRISERNLRASYRRIRDLKQRVVR